MDCPNCQNKMNLKKVDLSYNDPSAKNKFYKREVYHCEVDDIWVTVESPTKSESVA